MPAPSFYKSNRFKIFGGALLVGAAFACCACRNVDKTAGNASADQREASEKQKTTANRAGRAARNRFEQNLPAALVLPDESDVVANRVLKDYGAVLVARGGALPPPKIIFETAEDCAVWQRSVPTQKENFGGVNIELQTAAMQSLVEARREARSKGLNFTARGTWAARRDYQDTVKIWLTRVLPGLNYWRTRGKISEREAARIRSLAPPAQVAEILRLESRNIFFSKDFSKSILYSATAPGCSQHLSLLAVDLNENGNPAVRSILARHGWFQTVVSDLPHFTFLGVAENELPALGLKKTVKDNRVYWTPE